MGRTKPTYNIVFANLDSIDICSTKEKWNKAVATNILNKIQELPRELQFPVYYGILENNNGDIDKNKGVKASK